MDYLDTFQVICSLFRVTDIIKDIFNMYKDFF